MHVRLPLFSASNRTASFTPDLLVQYFAPPAEILACRISIFFTLAHSGQIGGPTLSLSSLVPVLVYHGVQSTSMIVVTKKLLDGSSEVTTRAANCAI